MDYMLWSKDRVTEGMRRDPSTGCLSETHFRLNDTHALKVWGWKKTVPANGSKKQAGEAILTSHKTDFERKTQQKKGVT